MDIIKAYTSINLIQSQLKTLQTECDKEFGESVWRKASEMAAIADTELTLPRICSRMTNRINILGKSAQVYHKVTLFMPIIDHLQLLNLTSDFTDTSECSFWDVLDT